MPVRLFTRTTPGKPVLAAAIMAGLLGLASLAAWSVSFHRAHQAIELGPPVALGHSATLAPPAGWTINPHPEENGAIADFTEPDGPRARSYLVYYEQSSNVISPAWLISEFCRKQNEQNTIQLSALSPSAIGPLPARQGLATTRRPDGLAKELVRVAIVGRREFLILRLICVGPPTDYELNLMDQVARSIQLDPGLYLPADKQARQIGVRLGSGPQAGNWVALAKTLPLDGLVLLPTTDGGKAGDPGFWGAVRIRKDSLLPNGDIKRLLADRAANPLARLLGRPVEPDEWTFARDGGESDLAGGGSGSLPAVEQRKVGGLAVWQIRGVDHDRDVVRLRLAFRPAVLQPGEDSDSADSPTSPAGAAGATGPAGAAGAQPGPGAPAAAVFATRQAIVLDAWSAAADEPAATAAIDRLIQSLRVP